MSARATMASREWVKHRAWHYYDELEAVGGRLIRERISPAEFERFLAQLVPLPQPRGDATNGGRAVRNAERVREAIATARAPASSSRRASA